MTEASRVETMVSGDSGVLIIRAEATVLMAAKKMRRHGIGCLVVIDQEGAPIGVVSERDLIEKVLATARNSQQVRVRDVMTDTIISVTTRASIMKAQTLMVKHRIRHLPVIEDGLLLGMISSRDIVGHQLDAVRNILEKQAALCRDLAMCAEEAESPKVGS